MNKVVENNKMFAEFLNWEKGFHQEKINNPKHPNFGKLQPKTEVFLLEDTHPIVENLYTDRPGFSWDYNKEDKHGNTINRLMFFTEDLKFHKSWDWLMLVIDKIHTIQMTFDNEDWSTFGNLYPPFIRGAYAQAVEFIELYNENKLV